MIQYARLLVLYTRKRDGIGGRQYEKEFEQDDARIAYYYNGK